MYQFAPTYDRTHLARKATYDELLADRGLSPDVTCKAHPLLWERAIAETDQMIDADSRTFSELIWASPLAAAARLLLDAVMRHEDDSDWALTVAALKGRYQRRRYELLLERLAESGQDVCRECQALKTAGEVRLVFVQVAYVHTPEHNPTGRESEYFGRLCSDCRTPLPPEQTVIQRPHCADKPFTSFRTVEQAVEFDGRFWIERGDDNYDQPLGSGEPDTLRAGPVSFREELATTFDLPPALDVHGSVRNQLVVIVLPRYTVPLQLAGAQIETAR